MHGLRWEVHLNLRLAVFDPWRRVFGGPAHDFCCDSCGLRGMVIVLGYQRI